MDLDRRTSSAILRSISSLGVWISVFLGSRPPQARRFGQPSPHFDASQRFPTPHEQTGAVAPAISPITFPSAGRPDQQKDRSLKNVIEPDSPGGSWGSRTGPAADGAERLSPLWCEPSSDEGSTGSVPNVISGVRALMDLTLCWPTVPWRLGYFRESGCGFPHPELLMLATSMSLTPHLSVNG
jgi:hypothetical protein